MDAAPARRSTRSAAPYRVARFRRRRNRFVAEVDLDPAASPTSAAHADGAEGAEGTDGTVAAYLPNTARLVDLLVPGRRVIVFPSDDPRRRTRWTLTRVDDGTWVSLEAAAASGALARHLRVRGFDGTPIVGVEREVRLDGRRVDLVVTDATGRRTWVEVKSTSRARARSALLSGTPSTRAAAQVAHLCDALRTGRVDAAVLAFVAQRSDVSRLVVDPADPTVDPAWPATVAAARDGGIEVRAYRSEVTPTTMRVVEPIPVVWRTGPR